MPLEGVLLLNLSVFTGYKGTLLPVESGSDACPFDIKRVYYIYNVPADERRGFHAHKQLHQVLICLAGSCKIEIKSRSQVAVFNLSSPDQALLVEAPVWREMYDFSPDCVLLCLASAPYDPSDYIWSFEDYLSYLAEQDDTCTN